MASREIEDAVRKLPAPKGCGPWVYSLDQIDPLPEAPDEDPAVTIARLEGRLEEVHTGESKGKKRAEA